MGVIRNILATAVWLAGLFGLALAGAAPGQEPPAVPEEPVYTYTVVNTFTHDPEASTQGLVFEQGLLYESTGGYGRSSLRCVELETGRVLRIHRLDEKYFGEGLAVWEGRLFQLTWRTNIGFIYDMADFTPRGEFRYPTEGWGLTPDGRRLIMSDGTAHLYFLDPKTLEMTGRVAVRDGRGPVANLNELEYWQGGVLANVWQTDRVAWINPETGRVRAWLDLGGLGRRLDPGREAGVLNGIALDRDTGRLFVTGKLWSHLFEIALRPGR
ncbi:MAG: glutaminyl-peptide cyclotransferase [Thermodesulfobacteriota bacterium]